MNIKSFTLLSMLAFSFAANAGDTKTPASAADMETSKITSPVLQLEFHRLGPTTDLLVWASINVKESDEPVPLNISRTTTYIAARSKTATEELLVPGSITEGLFGEVENKATGPDVLRLSIDAAPRHKTPTIRDGLSIVQTTRTQLAMILTPGKTTKSFKIDGVPHQLVVDYKLPETNPSK